jgi:hypothetical protein
MFTSPDPIGQLARQHHHDMLAQASQHTQRNQHSRLSSAKPDAAGLIARHLANAIARAGVVAAETAGATWLTRPTSPPRQTNHRH